MRSGKAEINPSMDGEAARGSEDPPPEIAANRVPKRLPGAWAVARRLHQAGRRGPGISLTLGGPDGPETKRMRTCVLELNDDPDEENDEWATGAFIDTSEVRAARKEETEFTKEIELFEDSTTKDSWSSTGEPPVSDSKKGEVSGRAGWPVTSRRRATRTRLTRTHPHRRWTRSSRCWSWPGKIWAKTSSRC